MVVFSGRGLIIEIIGDFHFLIYILLYYVIFFFTSVPLLSSNKKKQLKKQAIFLMCHEDLNEHVCIYMCMHVRWRRDFSCLSQD